MKYKIACTDYKFQVAIKKPWYRSSSFYHKISRKLEPLPNWRVWIENNYLIIDLYFNGDGWNIDSNKVKYETVSQRGMFTVTQVRDDILPEIKEFIGI